MAEIYQAIAFGFKRPTLKTLVNQELMACRPDTS